LPETPLLLAVCVPVLGAVDPEHGTAAGAGSAAGRLRSNGGPAKLDREARWGSDASSDARREDSSAGECCGSGGSTGGSGGTGGTSGAERGRNGFSNCGSVALSWRAMSARERRECRTLSRKVPASTPAAIVVPEMAESPSE
jgi:hypothetical protein